MYDDIGGFAEHGCSIRNHGHSPWSVRRADNFAEIAACFGRVFIDCADHFDGVFFAKQADNGGSDGADPILNGANFLFLQSEFTFFLKRFRSANQGCENCACGASYDCRVNIKDSERLFNTCSMRMCSPCAVGPRWLADSRGWPDNDCVVREVNSDARLWRRNESRETN